DPIWRAFSAVRDAIDEERSVDLTIIRAYEWEQSDWQPGGIDSCTTLDDPNSARQIYFGWTFTITSMRGEVFQGRISFDLKNVVVCDQVVTEQPVAANGTPDPSLPTPIPGAAATGSFELGG